MLSLFYLKSFPQKGQSGKLSLFSPNSSSNPSSSSFSPTFSSLFSFSESASVGLKVTVHHLQKWMGVQNRTLVYLFNAVGLTVKRFLLEIPLNHKKFADFFIFIINLRNISDF